jgi:hypothetical protein
MENVCWVGWGLSKTSVVDLSMSGGQQDNSIHKVRLLWVAVWRMELALRRIALKRWNTIAFRQLKGVLKGSLPLVDALRMALVLVRIWLVPLTVIVARQNRAIQQGNIILVDALRTALVFVEIGLVQTIIIVVLCFIGMLVVVVPL